MNDFMRPALYDAKHQYYSSEKNNKKIRGIMEFVGPICESTCKFGKYKKIIKKSLKMIL